MSRVKLSLQNPPGVKKRPRRRDLRRWAEATLWAQQGRSKGRRRSLVIRIVDEEEGAELNRRYRQGQGATNVLSFPWETPLGMRSRHLGDLVICASLVRREARAQGKGVRAHWAHLVVHGVLHLLGMDHQDQAQAAVMEAAERDILAGLGFPDPYGDAPGAREG